MVTKKNLLALYFINATILLTHQIDAAYWHEWNLFGIPGGIQVFLLLNIPIIFLVLYGVKAIANEEKTIWLISWLLAGAGIFAFVFHTYHLLRGDERFRLPISLGLLVSTLILSLIQINWTARLQKSNRL